MRTEDGHEVGPSDPAVQPVARSGRQARRQARLAAAAGGLEFELWDYSHLAKQTNGLFSLVVRLLGAYALFGSAYLATQNGNHAAAFAMISVGGWLCLEFWLRTGASGIPLLLVTIAPTILLNSLPLLDSNTSLDEVKTSTVLLSGETFALYFFVLGIGWWLGFHSRQSKPSAWNLFPPGVSFSGNFGLKLSCGLMILTALLQMFLISGMLFRLPAVFIGFLQVFQEVGAVVAMLGAFFGGLVVARQPLQGGSLIFWALFVLNFLLYSSGVLLSAAIGMVLSGALGLGFRTQRVPWAYLAVTVAVVSFLNQGKFEMRSEYWDSGASGATITLSDMPKLYSEWIAASAEHLAYNFHLGRTGPRVEEKEGQSMMDRLDNLNNMNFIVGVLESQDVPILYGESYTMIPTLLIPRFLWPDKPRTHAGQVLLNLHFYRQNDLDATFNTYIAWGLLPEAVGNFGCWLGAAILGLVLGFLCGWIEIWSTRKRIFSIGGLVALATMIQFANSFELVASVFITAMFQLVCVTIVLGLILRWLSNNAAANHRPQRAGLRRSPLPAVQTGLD